MPQIESLLEAQTQLKEPDQMSVRTLDRAHANAADFGGQVGSALEDMGSELGRFASIQQRDQKQLADFQAQSSWQQLIGQEQQNLEAASRGIKNGGSSFTQSFMNGSKTDPATGATMDAGTTSSAPDGAGVVNTAPPSFKDGNAQDAAAASVGGNDGGLNGRIDKWLADNTGSMSPVDQARWQVQAQEFKRTMGLAALKTEFKARDDFYKIGISDGLSKITTGITQSPTGIDNYIKQGEALIDASGLSTTDKAALKQSWQQQANLAYGYAKAQMDPEGTAAALGSDKAGYFAKLAQKESGGNPDAQASTTSASGLYQFTDSAWKAVVNSPEGQQAGLTIAGKNDPSQQNAGIKILTAQNLNALRSAGIDGTEKNAYMAHFLGAGGAVNFLQAMQKDPTQSAVSISPQAAASNPTIFYDKQGQPRSLAAVYNALTGSFSGSVAPNPNDPHLAALPLDARLSVMGRAETAAGQQQAAIAHQDTQEHEALLNQMKNGVADGTYNQQDLNAAYSSGFFRTYDERASVQNLIDARDKETAALTVWGAKVSAGQAFNPFDSGDRSAADAAFTAGVKSGQNPTASALQVYRQSGIIPDQAGAALHGQLISQDPKQVSQAANVLGNLISENPNVFAGVKNGSELEQAGLRYNHLVNDMGMKAEDAAAQMQKEMRPDYQSTVKVNDDQVKQFTADIRKSAQTDLPAAFGSFFGGNPKMPVDAAARDAMTGVYAEAAADNFRQTGDPAQAKAWAVAQVKKTFGVSNGTLMMYPPERVYPANVTPAKGEGPYDYIYKQAAADIKAATGEDVDPKGIYLAPITRDSMTANAWKSGQLTPYELHYMGSVDGIPVPKVVLSPNSINGRPWAPNVDAIKFGYEVQAGHAAAVQKDEAAKAAAGFASRRAQQVESQSGADSAAAAAQIYPGGL